ncbi:zinc metallopeptidase [Peptoniphilus obesi]|uniref:zinc metallopeptidase n=1 Tax=Peptoniphilus obesi TaxID=1472765 RepID=UPI0004BBDD5D|nr:zinc metallopeptidase [Peptoniphilus obesi]
MYGYYGYGFDYLIYILPGLLLALYAQAKINSAYSKYLRVDSNTGLTGRDVARRILDRNGLNNVEINRINGKLTDNFNPETNALYLSDDIYNRSSVASLAIAAHEVGHAIQHASGYTPIKIRAALVPAANIGSQTSMFLIMLGLFFSSFFLKVGIALFAITVLFQIVTLPVEFDASRRAQKELAQGILNTEDLKGSKKVLEAAALTYIASTIVAIGQLLRLLALSRRRD